MSKNMDALGDRMKGYEMLEAGRTLLPRLPVLARLDGKAFHTFTRKMERPFDERFSSLMRRTTEYLVKETHARVGYTQSDEISLMWYFDNPDSEALFGGRVQKLTSILASMAGAFFNRHMEQDWIGVPVFDCRVWVVPDLNEAANAFLWREQDATKNSVQMLARAHFSHKQCQDKDTGELHQMLNAAGIIWDHLPDHFRRGSYVFRVAEETCFTAEDIAALPPEHAAHKTPDLKVIRHRVGLVALPPLGRIANRVGVLFLGEKPAPHASQPPRTAS